MTKIYCITAWDNQCNMRESALFMSKNGIVKHLIKQCPIDNKYYITGDGAFDITEDNIGHALDDSIKQGMALSIKIKQDFGVVIESQYTISIIYAED